MYEKQTSAMASSLQANYTDWSIAAAGEIVPTFAGRAVSNGQRNGSLRPLISVF
jgi:hypothetical protein